MKWLLWFDLPALLGFAAAIVLYSWAWDARHVIGMAIAAIGFLLWFAARLQLGESFAVLPKARALVTTGLYSKFRNPIYLFGGLAYGGLIIAWGKVIPLIVFFSSIRSTNTCEPEKRRKSSKRRLGMNIGATRQARGCDYLQVAQASLTDVHTSGHRDHCQRKPILRVIPPPA
jgi:phospholipid methyltransferase